MLAGALLVFDEVMTGFRVALGGAQARYGVRPDLTTIGKVIGGGLPIGAYGGRADVMDHILPAGRVFQAGTLSGNPVATAAGSPGNRRRELMGYPETPPGDPYPVRQVLNAPHARPKELIDSRTAGMLMLY